MHEIVTAYHRIAKTVRTQYGLGRLEGIGRQGDSKVTQQCIPADRKEGELERVDIERAGSWLMRSEKLAEDCVLCLRHRQP